jgi:hypothetical protein
MLCMRRLELRYSDEVASAAVPDDVSPENDGRSKLAYADGFGGPVRKERTHEAVNVLGGTDCLRDPPG